MIRIILLVAGASCMTGCMSFSSAPWQEGSVVVAGDTEGMNSLFDGLNGLVAAGKTQDPLADNAHWAHRRGQEQQKTARLLRHTGFMQRLLGASEQGGEK